MEYIPSIIQAVAAIISSVLGAFIAAGYISKIFKTNLSPLFRTYSDNRHDAHKIMRTAKNSIYIVAAVGDQFLEKYEKHIEKYLKKGISIRFLMQTEKQFYELEYYINANNKFDKQYYKQVREKSLNTLKSLKSKFPNQVEIKEFNSFFSASYIGIDIEQNLATMQFPAHAIIQVMLYQYGVTAKKCPITYFSLNYNQDLFESTANSILEMWNDGTYIIIDN